MSPLHPRTRRTGLKIQELPDEILIFDTRNDQANCLNATAAQVWKLADGTRAVSDIAREMTQTFGSPVDARVVWYALEQLAQKGLLEESAPVPTDYAGMTRRTFLTRAGVVGAAVAIPVIVSILAPTPAHAQSGCLDEGQNCTTSEQCCSECCLTGLMQCVTFAKELSTCISS